MASAATAPDISTPERVYLEKVGNTEWTFKERLLDVHDDVTLWAGNPRLRAAKLAPGGACSEMELEAALEATNGYAGLKKSIDELGQMDPIYVFKPNENAAKYLVLEGATRVSILRQLDRKYTSGLKEGTYRRVRAKVLPPEFGERERAILLARIHVRGSNVRSWGRFVEAEFVYDTCVGKDGNPPLMNVAQLAQNLEKSTSFVQRMRDAAEFAHKFVEHVDSDEGVRLAAENFSVLEELSKARIIGPQLRDYNNPLHDSLRAEVFDMVENEVFKEYRDARFLKDFHDDPDKWEQLKSGERHIASTLVNDVKSNFSSPRAKIAAVPLMVKRSIERGTADFDEEDIEALHKAVDLISDQVHQGVRPFRVAMKKFTKAMTEASMADAKDLSAQDWQEFKEAREYFDGLVEKHWKPAQ